MRKADLNLLLAAIIEGPLPTWRKLEEIWKAMGQLTPEPHSGNIKPVIENYNKHLIKRVGREPKTRFTPQEKNTSRAIMRKLGLI